MTYGKLFETMIDSAVKAYQQIYGENKWNSLTEAEKNEVVHTIVMDFCKICKA